MFMDFLDNMSRKISDTGLKAVNKSKELGEINKLNSAISNEEKMGAVSINLVHIKKLY